MNDWDGLTERRAAGFADQRSRARETIEVPIVVLVIGFTAVVLFQIGALIQHAVLSHDHDADRDFRRQVNCLIVGQAQGKTGADLLSTCGFLRLGG